MVMGLATVWYGTILETISRLQHLFLNLLKNRQSAAPLLETMWQGGQPDGMQ